MCGSGTIAIEAALIARNIAPGVFRQHFAFEKWPDFDADIFGEIYNDDSAEREFGHKIFASDIDPVAVATAKSNAKAAGVIKDIQFAIADIKDFDWDGGKAIMVVNPPYGERLTPKDLGDIYACLGERLKHKFTGNTAWIISSSEDAFDSVGLKSSETIDLYNGPLECKYKKYETFSGKYKDNKISLSGQNDRDDRTRAAEQRTSDDRRRTPRRETYDDRRRGDERNDRRPRDQRDRRGDDRRPAWDGRRRDDERNDRRQRDRQERWSDDRPATYERRQDNAPWGNPDDID